MNEKVRNASDEQKKRWMLAVLGVVFMVGVSLVLNSVPITRLRSDIYLRWYATNKLFDEDRDLYSPLNGQEVDQIVYGQPSGMKPGFYYPAHLILFTAPLAKLPYRTAHFIWTLAVQFFFFASLWILIRETGWPATANGVALFMVMAALVLPSLQHTIWGQFNTIGMLGLALSYMALRRERYGWAGIWAVALTVKPQNYALLLIFLFIWAFSKRTRWRFIVGFGVTAVFMWIIPAIFQPNWVFDFFGSLNQYIPVSSSIDMLWNPYQITAIALSIAAMLLFFRNRKTAVVSASFAGCLSLSLAVWALVFPVSGMFHVLPLALAVILLMPHWLQRSPRFYRLIWYGLMALFVVGWIAFIIGLTLPGGYGLHIFWTQLLYKDFFPLFIAAISLPLCLSTETSSNLELNHD